MPTGDALVAAGLLLYYLHRHPGTPVPYDSAGVRRVLDEAEHALAFGNSVVAGLIGLRRPFDPGSRETTMLHAVAQAASDDAPAGVLEYLCARGLDGVGGPASRCHLLGLRTSCSTSPATAPGGYWTPPAKRDHPARRWQARVLPRRGTGTRPLTGPGKRTAPRIHRRVLRRQRRGLTAGRRVPSPVRLFGRVQPAIRGPQLGGRGPGRRPPVGVRNPTAAGARARLGPARSRARGARRPGRDVMPPAAAARPSGRRIRRALVADGALRAVISLPPKLAAHYALALQIWVLAARNRTGRTPTCCW